MRKELFFVVLKTSSPEPSNRSKIRNHRNRSLVVTVTVFRQKLPIDFQIDRVCPKCVVGAVDFSLEL